MADGDVYPIHAYTGMLDVNPSKIGMVLGNDRNQIL
jgi:hypothetical protein